VILKLSVWAGWSASVAVTVITAVVFSATLAVALLVITGALSLAEVTVTAMAWLSVLPWPSDTWTVTS
jgi:uncharacterized membrane protein SirB2